MGPGLGLDWVSCQGTVIKLSKCESEFAGSDVTGGTLNVLVRRRWSIQCERHFVNCYLSE